jgi:hypothetical protein
MYNRHTLARVGAFGTSLPSPLLSQHQPERIVKDVVQTRPVRDAYAQISRASERLNAGKSVVPERNAGSAPNMQPA